MASGKSAVGRLMSDLGVPVVDADQLARKAVAPGMPAHADIAQTWPDVIDADGTLNRQALAQHIFNETDARKTLERITHPRIQSLADQAFAELGNAGHKLVAYEAALLIETNQQDRFDAMVVVSAPEDVQIDRAIARGGLDRAQAEKRLAAQLPLDDKVARATHVINNGGIWAETKTQVEALVKGLFRQVEKRDQPG